MNDVVITGLGPISAIGIGREDFLNGIEEERTAIRPLERLPAERWPGLLAAECLDFAVEDYLESEKTYLDRASELALAACHLALDDAELNRAAIDPDRFGLALGTAYGCLDSMARHTDRLAQKGARFTSPVIFQHSYANTPTSLCAIEYDIQGPAATFCDRALSGATALQYAFDVLRSGGADVMLAGGVEALSEPLLRAWQEAGMLDDPGFVPGEGAGLVLLETAEHAAARGAAIQGRLRSVAVAWDPEPWEAGTRAMHAALEGAGDSAPARVFYCTEGLASLEGLRLELVPETVRGAETLLPETALGQTFAAEPGLSIAWACGAAGETLITSVDPGGGAAAVALDAGAGP